MTDKLHFVDENSFGPVTLDAAVKRLESTPSGSALVVNFADQTMQEMMVKVVGLFRKQSAERLSELSESRIDALLDTFLALDPVAPIEARIDLKNAEKRKEFLDNFAVVDAIKVHEIAGHTGSNPSQTAAAWRKANKILGVPAEGKTLFPLFQFDDAGRPFPLLRNVLEALPREMTPWQRAFWLVSPLAHLDGRSPMDAVRTNDKRAISAAADEANEVMG